jgi:hypothetical protein
MQAVPIQWMKRYGIVPHVKTAKQHANASPEPWSHRGAPLREVALDRPARADLGDPAVKTIPRAPSFGRGTRDGWSW